MRVNEFVKKFGWDKAKEVVTYRDNHAKTCNTYIFIGENGGYSTSKSYTTDGLNVNVNDLKRLVESWELVESYGGLSHIGRLKNLINKTPKGATHACFQFNKFYRYDDFYGKWEEFWDAGSGLWVTVCGKHSGKVFSINKMKQAIKDVESCQ